MELLRAKLALALSPGVGPIKFQEILRFDPTCTWWRHPNLIRQLNLNKLAKSNLTQPPLAEIDKIIQWTETRAQHLICIDTQAYPKLLSEIYDPPPFLYVKGELAVLQEPQIAIVGCRDMTPYGQMCAWKFGQELAGLGLVINSGLAYGIDSVAHQAALRARGKTIAVLGTGLNTIYPQPHQALAEKIIAEQGALVSELPPDTGIRREHFPRRNRIISGLSLGTLVIEAMEKSGSLITARSALEQNRSVFAIPGMIDHSKSRGCHQLLREGAILVENIEDILLELKANLKTASTTQRLPLTAFSKS